MNDQNDGKSCPYVPSLGNFVVYSAKIYLFLWWSLVLLLKCLGESSPKKHMNHIWKHFNRFKYGKKKNKTNLLEQARPKSQKQRSCMIFDLLHYCLPRQVCLQIQDFILQNEYTNTMFCTSYTLGGNWTPTIWILISSEHRFPVFSSLFIYISK